MVWTLILSFFVFRTSKRHALAVIAVLYLLGGVVLPIVLGVDNLPHRDKPCEEFLYGIAVIALRVIELEIFGMRKFFKSAWINAARLGTAE